jgi:hypothetical protein
MTPTTLTVARHGREWSISAGREILVLARTRKAALALAASSAEILRGSGSPTEVTVAAEPRSFQPE